MSKYSKEFKEEALKLSDEIEVKKAALQLGLHSDRGSQYTSEAYRKLLKSCGIMQSLSGTGHCYDNGQYERGIFGGSRTDKNETAEIGTLIFTGGSYEKFKDSVSVKRGAMDVGISNHDYLVDASANGAVVPNAAGTVEITANYGYYTIANGTETANGEFKLSD